MFGGAGAPGGGTGKKQSGRGGFADLFSQFFRSGPEPQEARQAPEKGADLEYGVNIDFWQAIRGTTVRVPINRQEVCAVCQGSGQAGAGQVNCPQCQGTGQVSQMAGAMRFNLACPRCGGSGKLQNACPACHGDGRAVTMETIEIRIPAGARDGSRLRVAGKGNAGTHGAPAGDLYINTRVEPHPVFRRHGDDIEITLPVTVWEAGLGAKIQVPTVDGKALLKIPQGTQNGQKLRLREKGVLNSRTGARGDLIVEVSVQAPKAQDERTRELLRELSALHPEDPRAGLWEKV
jgi:molecular chaperone DnaJ